MGMLIKGRWVEEDTIIKNGAFRREPSKLNEPFQIEANERPGTAPRYWLIASKSCPWSHRALIMRKLQGLDEHVALHIAHGPRRQGYAINGGNEWDVPGVNATIVHLHQLYTLSDPRFTGRSTVPVLWDTKEGKILSNDSEQILRALNTAGCAFGPKQLDFYPTVLREEIDALNTYIYEGLSNAVYRAGFAQSQKAYTAAVTDVFATLDRLEDRLSRQRFLIGNTLSEADWRLFPTLVRFDSIYYILHRCCRKRLIDYPHLWAYARDLYAWPGIKDVVDFEEIRSASYINDTAHNPHAIVAVQPSADWDAPHGRESLGEAEIYRNFGDVVA